MTRSDLSRAERLLRRDDKALRLRFSLEDGGKILIERKTFRGRIGALGPGGLEWRPDTGYRREHGLVAVASVPSDGFVLGDLRMALRAADTWKKDPLWRRVEEQDEMRRAKKKLDRKDNIRYKTSELFDRYMWRSKARVSVPEDIT